MTNAIHLAILPDPDVVQPLDYDSILSEMLADLRHRAPELTALVASDPAYKILEVAAYRELLLRQRVNDAGRSVMLAYAKGKDLDHLAALFGVSRLVIDPGNPDAIPAFPATYEDDERLRQRIPLSLEGYSTAGPIGAYVYHTLAASGDVKDVSVTSPSPGEVRVTVLSMDEKGVPDAALLQAVTERLNHEAIRPLTDHITVQAADIIEYHISAHLTFYPGPDRSVVAEQSRIKVTEYATQQHQLGFDVTLSGLYAALHQPGVQNVRMTSPAEDILVRAHQAAFATAIHVSEGG
ncbi:hypothetical protein BJP41_09270 [Candidatus Williamhamiltonella defendens]|uniref:Baseplate assembly protein n=2 Tax=Candidatus Williamhamiltonella defendens TaxID=138072 RepID=A0A2D3SZ92_9ENTR|nr:baseplate J/gp47 family protein [Candidatus Hamiltonella defensa]ACQ68751.1 phage baseplate J-like protein [Candidatus Hamiltonella defensa 5AT (Acyrthosiphon pisum)]ASV34143.1 baseplate assembly protein [Candidatus Hamiltonella defensa]ATW23273.1 hypothetical protein BJP44_09780 [Candidatus Hamiltonella defensa]ATW30482.1 hypothetical protein BJP41_09270 [Candidatus Hamiltonella defensa]ATW32492.1 hypothetical protein BJP42_09580 [Candidatus Hamiltonella defensa]